MNRDVLPTGKIVLKLNVQILQVPGYFHQVVKGLPVIQ
jgi:hypothetical protein